MSKSEFALSDVTLNAGFDGSPHWFNRDKLHQIYLRNCPLEHQN